MPQDYPALAQSLNHYQREQPDLEALPTAGLEFMLVGNRNRHLFMR
jgi:hypothetical protein